MGFRFASIRLRGPLTFNVRSASGEHSACNFSLGGDAVRRESVLVSRMNETFRAAKLPDEVQALFFVCDCFALGEQELSEYRMKLSRARVDKSISKAARERIRIQLFHRLRRAIQTPVSHATFVTDELVARLLEVYAKVHPRLRNRFFSLDAIWVLAEHVLVPTAHLIIRKKHRCGLGTEFLGQNCWYLPERAGTKIRKPVQRVLDCWLRVAGLRTDYRVSKEIGNEAVRRKVNRWLEGENQPTLDELYGLVDEFSAKVSWLDEPASWKARFTLACAAQRAWNEVDDTFQSVCRFPSLKLADKFRALASQPILQDDRELLVLADTFFAVSLLQNSLQKKGRLDEIIAPSRKERRASFGPEIPDVEIDLWKLQAESDSKPGNWFLRYVRDEAIRKGGFTHDDNPMEAEAVRDYIFELGIEELNRLLNQTKGNAGGNGTRQL